MADLAYNIIWYIFTNGNFWNFIEISLNFPPNSRIDNKSSLVQVLTWHLAGDNPLSEPMMTQPKDASHHFSELI